MQKYELCTQFIVSDFGRTQEVVIYGNILLGEVLEEHDRARYMGYSDGAFSTFGERENLQNGAGDAE